MTGSTSGPRGPRPARLVVVLLAALLVALGGAPARVDDRAAAGAGDVPRVAVTGTYVAGVSSGGYMATQLQVAHSRRILGAGVFAAGPYWWAMGNLALAPLLHGEPEPRRPGHPLRGRAHLGRHRGDRPDANLRRSRTCCSTAPRTGPSCAASPTTWRPGTATTASR